MLACRKWCNVNWYVITLNEVQLFFVFFLLGPCMKQTTFIKLFLYRICEVNISQNVCSPPCLLCSSALGFNKYAMEGIRNGRTYHLLVQASRIQWSHHQLERGKTCLQALKKCIYFYTQYIQATDVFKYFRMHGTPPTSLPQYSGEDASNIPLSWKREMQRIKTRILLNYFKQNPVSLPRLVSEEQKYSIFPFCSKHTVNLNKSFTTAYFSWSHLSKPGCYFIHLMQHLAFQVILHTSKRLWNKTTSMHKCGSDSNCLNATGFLPPLPV